MLTLTMTGTACVTEVTPPLTGVQVHRLLIGRVMTTSQGPWKGRDSGRDSEISTNRTEERVKACQIICPTKAFTKTKALMNNIVSITMAFDILMLKKSYFLMTSVYSSTPRIKQPKISTHNQICTQNTSAPSVRGSESTLQTLTNIWPHNPQ